MGEVGRAVFGVALAARVAAALAGAAISAPSAPTPKVPPPVSWARAVDPAPLERTPARIARGKYLAEGATQCFLCHSERDWEQPGAPPKEGFKGAGQVIIDRPDLRVVAPNLTPDMETGAGSWPDDALVRAIREGVGHDNRPLHMPMWWRAFRRLSDEDVRSIVVYLRTLPPVHRALPATMMSDKERERLIEKVEPLTAPVPPPDQSTPLARGRYLIGIADCAGCHTAWEAPRNAGLYAGGNVIVRGERRIFSANITPDPTGMPYDEKTFVTFMRNGKFGTLSPLMPWAAFRNMSDSDLADVRTALRRVWPYVHRVNNSEAPTHCPVCLQEHGGGDSNPVPVAPKGVAMSHAALEKYVGSYRAREDGQLVRVHFAGGHLVVGEGEDASELVPLENGLFYEVGGVTPARFDLDAQGRVLRMVEIEVDDYVYDRVPEAASAPKP